MGTNLKGKELGKGLYQRKDDDMRPEFSFAVQEKRFQFMVQIYNI